MSRKLRDWLTGYMSFTENTESPVNYHKWVGISCIAGALQRKVWLTRGHETIYPNHYIILIGPSGRARKGTAVGIGRRFLEGINIPFINEDSTNEAAIIKMKNATSVVSVPGHGERIQCAVSCIAEELAVFTGYQNTEKLAYLTQWYNSEDRWTRDTKHQGTDEIVGMCFNLLGATAPDWIPHIFTKEAVGGGFTSRCVFVVETRKAKTIPNPDAIPINEQLREDLLSDLERISTMVGPFKWEKKAHLLYQEWYKEQDARLERGQEAVRDPAFDGYLARRPTQIVKTSMVLSASRSDNRIIECEDFLLAKKLLDSTEKNMAETFSGIGKNKYAEELEMVRNFLAFKKQATRADIFSALQRHLEPQSLDSVVSMLSDMKAITIERDVKGGNVTYKWLH